MIDIRIGSGYRLRWSKKEKGFTLSFEIDGDQRVGRVEVSMLGDGMGPYLAPTFADKRDGRNCRGLEFKPERIGSWYPFVKAFHGLNDTEPMASRRAPVKVMVTDEDVFLPADPAGPAPFQIRGFYYYPWYADDGWGPGSRYMPTLGRYELRDPRIVDRHIEMLLYGRADVAIASWWGQGHKTDTMLPSLLERSEGTTLRWCIYHEFEGHTNPSPEIIRNDLEYVLRHYANHPNYLKIGGKFVVFVYSANDGGSCDVTWRWREAARDLGAYIVLKSIENYSDCPNQPDGWHQYGPDRDVQTTWDNQGRLHSYNISPGFNHILENGPRLSRDPLRWQRNVRDMIASKARWQLITSFNEFVEGTGVEPCEEWRSPSGYGTYLDILHNTEPV